jgi:large subunit ribosomal protein L21
MRAVPVAEYPPSEGGVQQVQVDHAVAPEFVEPVSAEDVEGNVFQPSVFAVADINGQQTKVHAGCLVMTDNLKLAPRAAYKREMFALNGVGSPDYAGPQGDALQEELNYWWEQLSVEEKQPYYEQQIQVGDRLVFDRVLLLGAMDWTVIGRPLVEGARVHATVKEHSETEKLIVYKKKRRKGYAKQKHHQSQVTVLHIDEVVHANGVDSCLDHYAAQEAAQQQQSAAEDSDVDSDSESQTTTTSQ